jgi:hypothetical protein
VNVPSVESTNKIIVLWLGAAFAAGATVLSDLAVQDQYVRFHKMYFK